MDFPKSKIKHQKEVLSEFADFLNDEPITNKCPVCGAELTNGDRVCEKCQERKSGVKQISRV